MTGANLTPIRFDPRHRVTKQLAFTPVEYGRRLDSLCRLMEREGIELLWLTTPEAVAWLHGCVLSWYKANGPMRYPQCYGTAVHAPSRRFIHFDNPTERPELEETSVSSDNRWLPDREGEPNLKFIMAELAREGWLSGKVALEFWSYIPNRAISMVFETAFRDHGCDVLDGSVVSREARRRKSDEELDCVRLAATICDVGHRAVTEQLRSGITELDLFGKVTAAMMAAGSEFPALLPIFSAIPLIHGELAPCGHRAASRRVIQRGQVLVADLCGVYNRYHANVLRCYFVGDDPPPKLVDRFERAGAVFNFIQNELRAGMTVGEVNSRLRTYYERVGLWTDDGAWGLGYELGLSLPPDWVGDFYFNLSDTKYLDRVFEPGMVTNFESMFGTALVDTLLWRDDRVEVLSKIPPRLLVGAS